MRGVLVASALTLALSSAVRTQESTDPEPQVSDPPTHWAFQAPQRPAVPDGAAAHPVDRFVQHRLARRGLPRSPEADRRTLLRRVSLDLTGLPPSTEEMAAFLVDTDAGAYERAVDRLLGSPHYGEHMAATWLDLARYADTKGYEKDARRPGIWRWREWVIEAFQRDLPFDQFTTEQIAGDLLPDAQPDQVLATAFHRNTMTNDEGGTDDEEFRVAAVVDRINTTMQVWMGLTVSCAQCHDHKYDPISQSEYFELYAFFNNTEDADRPSDAPTRQFPSREDLEAQVELQQELADNQAELGADRPETRAARRAWEVAQRQQVEAQQAMALRWEPWSYAGGFPISNPRAALSRGFKPAGGKELTWQPRPNWRDGAVQSLGSKPQVVHFLRRKVTAAAAGSVALELGSDDGVSLWVNDQERLRNLVYRGAALGQEKVTVPLVKGDNTILLKIVNGNGPSAFAFEAKESGLTPELMAALRIAPERRTAAQRTMLIEAYSATAPELKPTRDAIARLRSLLAKSGGPKVPVLVELQGEQRRKTHIHIRGSFLDKGAEVVEDTPAVLHPWPADAPRNRLGLARWLVADDNPLTSRVLVNRLWEHLFGQGLVATPEDFGLRGAAPTHPDLLDWLAVEVRERDWSVKQMLRLLVTSQTYRQASRSLAAAAAEDPENRLLWRGPRFRLSAEAVRDQALAVSGLLHRAVGGPSVMPPQPDGVWQVVYSNDRWQNAKGADRYRRGVYTFWRRTSPYPAMEAFDAPSREFCVVRRLRSSSPLQALVTLNDPAFVEMAQALARRMMAGGRTPAERLRVGFERALLRQPGAAEQSRLLQLWETARDRYGRDREAALAFATKPLGPLPEGLDPVAAAAWTAVANVLLNLDEFLTKG